MKRGIIRIIAGVVLLAVQLLSLIGLSSVAPNTSRDIWFNIGFYSPAIIGVILLFFGSRACRNGIYSKLILHNNNKKVHTVMKWSGFVLSTLLFIWYLLTFIDAWPDFEIFSILIIFAFLSFSVYTLFYMYQKPSCLFSTTLIFIGVAYLYGIIGKLADYVLYLPDTDYFIAYLLTGILPRLAAGILYITIASIIHKENFSEKAVKVLGWIVFMCEILTRVVTGMVVLQRYVLNVLELLYLLFAIILMLYVSVFKVNTLRDAPAHAVSSNFGYQSNFAINAANMTRWQCSCGRVHPTYETSCVCGKSKFDTAEHLSSVAAAMQPHATSSPRSDKIRFCRKCGEKFVDESRFCRICGTQVVDKVVSPEE